LFRHVTEFEVLNLDLLRLEGLVWKLIV